jgi:Flp pilus assembly protein TadG
MIRHLAGDAGGSTLPEFAIILPSLLMLLFGIFDIGQEIYVKSVLQGALQDAGRGAGLESGPDQTAAIDAYVRAQLEPVAISDPTYKIERANYQTFSDVGRPENFVDANDNDIYDGGECFTDENANGLWDEDVGKTGLGGANDVVRFKVTVTYDRIFPLWKLIGASPQTSLTAATVLRSQPYGGQAARTKTLVCPA